VERVYVRMGKRIFGTLAPHYAEADFTPMEVHALMDASWHAARPRFIMIGLR